MDGCVSKFGMAVLWNPIFYHHTSSYIISGWWWLEHGWIMTFHILRIIIIPTDELIFSEELKPPTRYTRLTIYSPSKWSIPATFSGHQIRKKVGNVSTLSHDILMNIPLNQHFEWLNSAYRSESEPWLFWSRSTGQPVTGSCLCARHLVVEIGKDLGLCCWTCWTYSPLQEPTHSTLMVLGSLVKPWIVLWCRSLSIIWYNLWFVEKQQVKCANSWPKLLPGVRIVALFFPWGFWDSPRFVLVAFKTGLPCWKDVWPVHDLAA